MAQQNTTEAVYDLATKPLAWKLATTAARMALEVAL